jgi:hypothetical protein
MGDIMLFVFNLRFNSPSLVLGYFAIFAHTLYMYFLVISFGQNSLSTVFKHRKGVLYLTTVIKFDDRKVSLNSQLTDNYLLTIAVNYRGGSRGGGPKIGKIRFFGVKSWFNFRASFRSAQFVQVRPPPLTWNPGSAPELCASMAVNMYYGNKG